MLAALLPEPGGTPLAGEYRDLVTGLLRGKARAGFGTFERDAYDPRSVREAEARWRKRMVDEYASTTVFSGLIANLVEANATLDTSAVEEPNSFHRSFSAWEGLSPGRWWRAAESDSPPTSSLRDVRGPSTFRQASLEKP